jgi:hypothetical protein
MDILGLTIGMLWFMIFTPIYLGFPIGDEGGINRVNMYPYIFPTALFLLFTFVGGWRWLKKMVFGY